MTGNLSSWLGALALEPDLWADIVTAVGLALVAYGATNLDNLLILVGLSMSGGNIRYIARGFVIANVMILLILASFIALEYFISPNLLGYLGIVPIVLGVRMLLAKPDDSFDGYAGAVSRGSVAVLLFGNSADTIATFAPLFAESEPVVRGFLSVGYLLGASLLLRLVYVISRKHTSTLGLQLAARRVTPFIMIAVGIYVLVDTGTDLV